ncbi:MAG: hypothetical protein QX189_16285 [Methylococcales bacterium]
MPDLQAKLALPNTRKLIATHLTHKANDIVNNNDAISKAVEELMGMEQDINELSNTDWSN